jgi:hypothetical protein
MRMNSCYIITGLGIAPLMEISGTPLPSHLIFDATCRNEIARAFEAKQTSSTDCTLLALFVIADNVQAYPPAGLHHQGASRCRKS